MNFRLVVPEEYLTEEAVLNLIDSKLPHELNRSKLWTTDLTARDIEDPEMRIPESELKRALVYRVVAAKGFFALGSFYISGMSWDRAAKNSYKLNYINSSLRCREMALPIWEKLERDKTLNGWKRYKARESAQFAVRRIEEARAKGVNTFQNNNANYDWAEVLNRLS